MRRSEIEALTEHDQTRAKKRLQRTEDPNQLSVFPMEELYEDARGPYQLERRARLRLLRDGILNVLEQSPDGVEFHNLTASLQVDWFVTRKDVGDAVIALADDELVDRSWKRRSERARRPQKGDRILLVRTADQQKGLR